MAKLNDRYQLANCCTKRSLDSIRCWIVARRATCYWCRRRTFILSLAWAVALLVCGGGHAHADEKLSPEIRKIISEKEFKNAHWGILVSDLKSGEVLYESNSDKLFAPASTTKLYSTAAALDQLGANFRFKTPIYRRGEIDSDGKLNGDLILLASGDLTLGGRTDQKGEIAFGNHDHTYANSNRTTDLTEPSPLMGLDQLARQVADANIKSIAKDVLIDDRLFEAAQSTGSGPTRLTPIMVNDNLIDFTIKPSTIGSPALVDYRPKAVFLRVEPEVRTVSPNLHAKIEITQSDRGIIEIKGEIPANHAPIVRVHEVPNPTDWARGLLIEALQRAGVNVAASAGDPNPATGLPDPKEYEHLPQVAVLESVPFSENIRLILKVSHNLHASTLPLLVASKHGKRTLADGLRLQHEFLKRAGIDADEISFGGGAGGANADFTTPRVNVQLLRYMATRPDFAVYERGLPILGVDGTLSDAVAKGSSVWGKARAKTGTLYWHNVMNDRSLLTSKALAGYVTAKSGRQLAFSFVVNGVHLKELEERNKVGKALARVCEAVYESQ